MARKDQYIDAEGNEVYKIWPDDDTGQMNDNGTMRALTADEIEQLNTPPIQSDAERIAELEAALAIILGETP